ncbi:hypothetical protein [Pseudonocardia alaniniphila]|uniref:DUF222 domain-containing protein n=1 Tax=Pseudonocardia alaniniphila TaxID=75291 RepID=A0ABS9TEV3_9PSEU|nr:hypothetical protein [Pseudonocardia alaniniphila]MCH6167042.1 hypothetical protein [Pseudonocardia alaniniphila]
MHAHTQHTAPHSVSHPGYLVKIAAAIDELNQQHHAALAMSHRTDAQRAARAARLALNSARMAAWWGVLSGYLAHDPQMHRLHLRAAVIAEADEKSNARFWREAAADWQARAEHRPTSDAAGALSNWHELGVTA